MKVKQKSIRSFVFGISGPEDEQELFSYIEQNREILQSFLVVIEGDLTDGARLKLGETGLKVLTEAGTLHAKEHAKPQPPREQVESFVTAEEETAVSDGGVIHYTTPIRSGTVLECEDDIVVFGRINSGAKVFAKKNAIIFSTIDGTVDAAGEYLIAKTIGKGQLFFHGEEVTAKSLNGRLCKVTLQNGQLSYEEL